MTTKLALIDPHRDGEGFPPLGIAYVAAAAEAAGADVEILPLRAIQMTHDDCLRRLETSGCRLIGIACHSMSAFPDTRALAERVRERLPGATILVGGIYPTFTAAALLEKHPAFDAVIRGEGEVPIAEIVGRGGDFTGVAGVTYRRGGDIVHNPEAAPVEDLDLLPMPARHLLPLDKFARGRGALLTSRGCRFNCSYCSPRVMFSRLRKHDLARVMAEIELLSSGYGIHHINVLDDDFTGDAARVADFCRMLVDRGEPIQWACSARVDEVSPELLDRMARSGCTQIFIGIESMNARTLRLARRGHVPDDVVRAVRWIHEAGIHIKCGVIVGLPGQTPGEAAALCEAITALGIEEVSPAFYTPLPGTRAWDTVRGYSMRFVETREERFDLIHPVVESDLFPAAEQQAAYLELLSLNTAGAELVDAGS